MTGPDYIEIPLRDRAGAIKAVAKVSPADAHLYSEDPRRPHVYLHRVVLGLKRGDCLQADHINGDRLDNRRENLRVTTRAQNGQNQPAQAGTSRYRGVGLHKASGKWRARLTFEGRDRALGVYETEEEAAEAAARGRAEFFTHANEQRSVVAQEKAA